MKLADDGSGDVIVRVYEALGRRAVGELSVGFDHREVREVSLIEDEIETPRLGAGSTSAPSRSAPSASPAEPRPPRARRSVPDQKRASPPFGRRVSHPAGRYRCVLDGAHRRDAVDQRRPLIGGVAEEGDDGGHGCRVRP